jgi:hypothetical protein
MLDLKGAVWRSNLPEPAEPLTAMDAATVQDIEATLAPTTARP